MGRLFHISCNKSMHRQSLCIHWFSWSHISICHHATTSLLSSQQSVLCLSIACCLDLANVCLLSICNCHIFTRVGGHSGGYTTLYMLNFLLHCPERFLLLTLTSAVTLKTDWRQPDVWVHMGQHGQVATMGPLFLDNIARQVHVVWDAIAV